MRRRYALLLGVVGVVAFIVAGAGLRASGPHPSSSVTDRSIESSRHSGFDFALRGHISRAERVETPRPVVERFLTTTDRTDLRVPESGSLALRRQSARQPAPLPAAPSLGRAPPALP